MFTMCAAEAAFSGEGEKKSNQFLQTNIAAEVRAAKAASG